MLVTGYTPLFRGTLPIGALKQLATVPVGEGRVLKQLVLSNGQGLGATPRTLYPWAICPGAEGVIYMAVSCTSGSGAGIIEITSSPAAGQPNMRLVAGLPGTSGTTNGTGTAARFSAYVEGLAYSAGKLYIADTSNNKIRVMDCTTYAVSDFAGSGSSAETNGTGAAAAFVAPRCICVSPDGTALYVGQSALAGGSSVRKITVPGAVVTSLSGTAGATNNTATDAVAIDKDGAFLWYTNRESGSAATSYLYRYNLGTNSRVEISDSAGNAGTDQTPSGLYALGATTASIVKFGTTSYTSLCCDPQDPAVVYFFDNANTASSAASNKIHRIRLLPSSASPTHFEITPFAFAGGNTANDTEGLGASGPQVGSTQSFLSPVAQSRNLLFADLGGSNVARVISVDTETAACAFVHIPGSSANAVYNGSTNRKAWVDVYALASGDTSPQAHKRLLVRELVDAGTSKTVALNSALGPSETLWAQSQNSPIQAEFSGLAFEE